MVEFSLRLLWTIISPSPCFERVSKWTAVLFYTTGSNSATSLGRVEFMTVLIQASGERGGTSVEKV